MAVREWLEDRVSEFDDAIVGRSVGFLLKLFEGFFVGVEVSIFFAGIDVGADVVFEIENNFLGI